MVVLFIPVAGGVLGFWGGVWCLGIIFILVLAGKRVAFRRGEERMKVIKIILFQIVIHLLPQVL